MGLKDDEHDIRGEDNWDRGGENGGSASLPSYVSRAILSLTSPRTQADPEKVNASLIYRFYADMRLESLEFVACQLAISSYYLLRNFLKIFSSRKMVNSGCRWKEARCKAHHRKTPRFAAGPDAVLFPCSEKYC